MRAFEAKVKAIEREGAHIWTAVPAPQQIRPKSDRLLVAVEPITVFWDGESLLQVALLAEGKAIGVAGAPVAR